jgi:Protein of unknown function (DUF3467)
MRRLASALLSGRHDLRDLNGMSRGRRTKRGPKAPLACYANYFEVGHNPYEFLLDFGQFQSEAAGVLLHTRIAVGPAHAKLFAEMLREAVHKFEADIGPIAEIGETLDPLEVVLRSLPDFERRAVNARRNAAADEIRAAEEFHLSQRTKSHPKRGDRT